MSDETGVGIEEPDNSGATRVEDLGHLGVQRRTALMAVFVVATTLVVVALPIKWHNVHLGTLPEWIGVVALLFVGAAVWSLARSIERAHPSDDHFR